MNERLSPLQQAFLALEEADARCQALEARLLEARAPGREPIAIIGMGCRFPGDVDSPEAFWEALIEGRDATGAVPGDRWDAEAYFNPDPAEPGRIATRRGGFLPHVDRFDPAFFGISPREARAMDPQQRLVLEVAWEALENAGQDVDRLAASQTGVYVGIFNADYALLSQRDSLAIDTYTGTGLYFSFAPGRISYALDLRGPSLAVDTACSSSLVALHLACQSLRDGECQLAIAGGVNVMATPESTILLSRMGVLAGDGHAKTFDAGADGMVRGEGCGMIVLKRLSDALADGDPVLAIVRGSAVNQDGRSNGMTAPSMLAQQALVRQALARAGVAPEQVGYVETHGTGTALGDPIEVEALAGVFRPAGRDERPLVLGAVKTNIGHLESAAGVAGLIKAVLALQHGLIPPNLHLKQPNPNLTLDGTPFVLPHTVVPFPAEAGGRFAGVSSFGMNGTNAHVVLEAGPLPPQRTLPADAGVWLLPFSARHPEALRSLAARYHALLSPGGASDIHGVSAVCHAASVRRTHHDHRLAVTGSSAPELRDRLAAYLAGEPAVGLSAGRRNPTHRRKLAFVFCGQGPQWWAMGRQLLQNEPIVRDTMARCDAVLAGIAGWSLLEALNAGEATSRLHETEVAQPVLFALQVSLVALWRSWGIEPRAVVGHSVGEVAAAHVAGIFGLEEALKLVYHRGRIMQRVTGGGRMAAVALSPAQAAPRLAEFADRVVVAAVNGPQAITVAGAAEDVAAILATWVREGVYCRELAVNYAFHTNQLDRHVSELAAALGELRREPAKLPMVSTLTGRPMAAADGDAAYWGRQMREPVQFAAAAAHLLAEGHDVFLEIGPHPVLAGVLRESAHHAGREILVLPSLRRNEGDQAVMRASLGGLYAAGLTVAWSALHEAPAPHVRLPNYPWHHERFWLTRQAPGAALEATVPAAPGRESLLPAPAIADLMALPVEARGALMLAFLQAHAARVLGLPVSRLAADVPLVLSGLDSMTAMELREQLGSQLGIALPVVRLLEGDGLSSLANWLVDELLQAGSARIEVASDPAGDSVLEPDIWPDAGRLGERGNEPAAIFLTGGTGFLGAFLLHELLAQTNATIFCLVRADDAVKGRDRLLTNLARYHLLPGEGATRIVPLLGDLARPRFGWSPDEFAGRGDQFDLIVHNGAHPNHLFPYSALKPANVEGVREVLRLACSGRPSRVHHVSTNYLFSVPACLGMPNDENSRLPAITAIDTGYLQSKWVGEQLIAAARERGLPVAISRPGMISAAGAGGGFNDVDVVCRLIKGFTELGLVPEVGDARVNLIPVDFTARAIVCLACDPARGGDTFHLDHPRPVAWRDLFAWLRRAGFALEPVPMADWKRAVLERAGHDRASALYAMAGSFAGTTPGVNERFLRGELPRIGAGRTFEALAALGCGECPEVDEVVFGRMLASMRGGGFLPDRHAGNEAPTAHAP